MHATDAYDIGNISTKQGRKKWNDAAEGSVGMKKKKLWRQKVLNTRTRSPGVLSTCHASRQKSEFSSHWKSKSEFVNGIYEIELQDRKCHRLWCITLRKKNRKGCIDIKVDKLYRVN